MSTPAQLAFESLATRPPDVRRLVRQAVEWAGGLGDNGLSAAELRLLSDSSGARNGVEVPPFQSRPSGDHDFADLLSRLRSATERRELGQFFTPPPLVDVMVNWVGAHHPGQVIDAGCGTGRFAIAAAQKLPDARILAIDADPVATLLCRAQVARLGLQNVEVQCADFLTADFRLDTNRAAFVGNPPYVRHHRLPAAVKRWGAEASRRLRVPFSGLAGLHVHFFLATALRARPGDVGCYITSAEWLDVRYGEGLRRLLLEVLGLTSLSLLEESSTAFADVMTSAAITCFQVGTTTQRVQMSVVKQFRDAAGAEQKRSVPYARLGVAHSGTTRWGALVRGDAERSGQGKQVRLGDIVSVHRGLATGANDFFVMDTRQAEACGLQDFAHPIITAGKQILAAAGRITAAGLKVVILLPKTLDAVPEHQRASVAAYLRRGEAQGYAERYLCRHRAPWWWLGATAPAPIVASYMARRPPAFALNPDGAYILNIAHGLYPRRSMSRPELERFTATLNDEAKSFVGGGRRYQGGLEKFEPREMEELLICNHALPPLRTVAG